MHAAGFVATSYPKLWSCALMSGLSVQFAQDRDVGTRRCLFLSDNHVADFPDMSLMPHLHTLELARNHLTTLGPVGISSAALCCLDLSHNQLTTLSQLHRLPCLRELTVSDNQLTSLEGLQVGCRAVGTVGVMLSFKTGQSV